MSGALSKFLNRQVTPVRIKPPSSKFKKRVTQTIQIIILTTVMMFAWWRISLHFEIKNQFLALKESGLPTSGTELNTWLDPVADSENGALPLRETFAQVRTFPDSRSNQVYNLVTMDRINVWAADTETLAAEYVALNQATLEEARTALKFHKFRFPIDYAYGPTTPIPHLASLKGMAQLFALRAVLTAKQDNNGAWSQDIKDILKLAQTLDSEPIVISWLVRAAIINLAVRVTEINLNHCPLESGRIEDLQSAIAAVTVSNLLSRAFVGELALNVPAFRLSRTEAEQISSDNEDQPQNNPQPQRFAGKPNPFLWFTGFFERDLNFFLKTMTTSIGMATNSAPAVLKLNNHFEEAGLQAGKKIYVLSGMLLPAYGKVANRDASLQANLRLVTTALAIEQYRRRQGQLPASLTELVPQHLAAIPSDPFDGAPLRYRWLPTGYVVYSVGDDRHDDDGRERPKNKKSSDKTSYDITFIVER